MGVYGPWLNDAVGAFLSGKTVKAMLMTDAFTHNPDAHYRSALANEATGTGYTAGGVVASGVAVAYDAATDRVKVTCDPIDFGVLTITSVGAVVFYVSTGSAATDVVLASDVFPAIEMGAAEAIYTPDPAGFVRVATA